MTYHAKIVAGGKISLPAEIRRALGLKDGDSVAFNLDGDRFTGMSYAAKIREVQAQFRRYVPEGVSVVDELIAERRAEAARE